MAGIYGNHPEDRAREHELDKYLEETFGESKESEYEAAMDRADYEHDLRKEEALWEKLDG